MKKKRYVFIILFFFILFFLKNTNGQIYGELIKNNCTDSINCQLQLKISDRSYRNIRDSRGSKPQFSDLQLKYNGQDIPAKSLKIRGKTSLYFPKKSFTLKLKKKLFIEGKYDTVSVKDCYLLSLSMDKNYVTNYTAYSLLKVLDLFNLTFSYCEVIINDESQGIYLIMERPGDYALKTLNSPVLIRRGFDMKIDKMDVKDKNESGSFKYYRKKFMHMYSFCNKYSGSQLYDSLNTYIDLSQYLQWIGFNYIIRNGDYTDELYLYFNPVENRFGIIPWDYDDLFTVYPHEGIDARRSVEGGQFIFSSEDRLDKTIIRDTYLYKKYLQELDFVTEQLNDSILTRIFQETYCSVYPYYLDKNIISTTRLDKYGLTNLDDLYINIQERLRTIRAIRDVVKHQLNSHIE